MKWLIFIFLFFYCSTQAAESQPYIAVGSARTKKTVMAVPAFKFNSGSVDLERQARQIHEWVTSNLEFMDLFRFLNASAFLEDAQKTGLTLDRFKLSDWTSISAEFLLKSGLALEGSTLTLEAHLYDTFGGKEILAKKYISTSEDSKTLAHTLANDVVFALTGMPGIFHTKIALSCERHRQKEIYMMDFDGTHLRQVTHHRSIAFAPSWSPDGTRIAYSLYAKHKNNIKNIDLYEFDFASQTQRMLSNRRGINSGAAYSPDGKRIAITMSFLGNPEIFSFDPTSGLVTRLTSSFGIDVDPAWSPDGKSLAFVSSRSGMPMIYSMALDGSHLQRLTYAGRYNATPSWSPQNNKIAFAGWVEGQFDIFMMNPDGTKIERLTKNQGNNEDPHFSPDGNFIVFSSNRTGQKNIYVMNVDGTFVKRLTYGIGDCVSPKWSAAPKLSIQIK